MRVLACHQPGFFPWLGWWEKFFICDVFVWMDDCLYKRRDYINRTQVLDKNGKIQWLTIPVQKEKHGDTLISDIKIVMEGLESLRFKLLDWYGQHAFLDSLILKCKDAKLEIFNHYCLNLAIEHFVPKDGVDRIPHFIFASTLEVETERTERIIDYCKRTECDTYFSGIGGKEYLDVQLMHENGIRVIWQNFEPYLYYQKNSSSFVRNLSILDALLSNAPLQGFLDRCVSKRYDLRKM